MREVVWVLFANVIALVVGLGLVVGILVRRVRVREGQIIEAGPEVVFSSAYTDDRGGPLALRA